MNDLEKSIIDLNHYVGDLYVMKRELHDECSDIKSRKSSAIDKEKRYSNKVNRISEQLERLIKSRLFLINVPLFGSVFSLLSILFNAPLSLVILSGSLGAICAYRLTNELIDYNLLRDGDIKLLTRLSPSVNIKKGQLDKAIRDKNIYTEKIVELTTKEKEVSEKYEEIVDSINKLNEVYISMCELYFSKLEREELSYYTDLETVISRTISNPEKFYSNICNGLTRKERKDIIGDMCNKTCDNCTNNECNLSNDEKENVINCENWYNEVEIGKSKVLRR